MCKVSQFGCVCGALVTSLATDELIPTVLHQLQDPFVLSIDALPRGVSRGVQVREVPRNEE